MKIKADDGIVIFGKLFVTGAVFYILITLLSYVFSILLGRNPVYGVFSLGIPGILLASFIISLISFTNYQHIAKAIRMDNRNESAALLTRALEKMKWKLESQTEERMVFCSPRRFFLWGERIVVQFTDTEVQLCGPREDLERVIRVSNFPYGSFEISKFE